MEKTIDHMEDTVSAVNKYGQDGWELVSVVAMFHSLHRSLIFKREIPEPATTPEELVGKTASHIHHSETRW